MSEIAVHKKKKKLEIVVYEDEVERIKNYIREGKGRYYKLLVFR